MHALPGADSKKEESDIAFSNRQLRFGTSESSFYAASE